VDSLRGFLLRTLVWLPICFAAWYYLSILFTPPLASLVDAALTGLFPQVIEGISADGNMLAVQTRVAVAAAGGAAGDLLFELNPLKYGYCVPLYTALVLATAAPDGLRMLRWLFGILVLAAVQVFGIGTEALQAVAFQLGEEGRAALRFAPWGYEALALAYQLGYLILPPVVPIMLWLGQFGETVEAAKLSNTSGRP
jgi:hypothetical protein